MSTPYSISKTSFLKFEQCEKAFFLYKNHPYLRDKIDVDKQLTFKRGHDVGSIAQQLFPGGADVSKETKNAAQATELTASLIESKAPVIYEATFVFNGVLIMVDILTLKDGRYTGYEVKSSIKVSDTYIKDACLQYYVLKNVLPHFDDIFLVTLNSDYFLEGDLDVKKLFKRRSVRQKAEENFLFFEHRIRNAHLLLEQNVIPNVGIGRHCFRPYQCDFFGSCWKTTITEDSIFNLPLVHKDKLFELHNAGIKTIAEVKDEHLEKDTLIRLKNAFVSGTAIQDKKAITEFLSRIKEPVAAMDMEIWNPAIPQIQGTRAFEQIPFLVCFYDGKKESHYFTDNKADDRRKFAEELLELSKDYATILVYDKSMEVIAIDNLANRFEDLRNSLVELKAKLVDVFEVFLNLFYYHPDFRSNFSLKMVSGYLLKDVDYSKVTSGLEAMAYYDLYRTTGDETEKEKFKTDLVTYCGTDSFATYRLVEFLRGI